MSEKEIFGITLWQPWASLVALGYKTIETRSWRFPRPLPCYLAIQAAARFSPEQRALCATEPFRRCLAEAGYPDASSLPLGAVLCTAVVTACKPALDFRPSSLDIAFGNFAPGRWGWLLQNVRRIDPPVPARGAYKLWRWQQSPDPVTHPDTLTAENPMANLNKVMLIGRLTREPEVMTFQNGGKKASFGFAVNNRRKDQQGNWIDDPVFVDVDAFNTASGKGRQLADLVEQYLHKGEQHYIECHLKLETWEDKNGGGKRQKLKLILDDVQFLTPKSDQGDSPPQQGRQQSGQQGRQQNQRGNGQRQQPASAGAGGYDSNDQEEIPF